MKFQKFKPLKNFTYAKGWDNFALDYVELNAQYTVYSLTKELMYKIINKNIHLNENSHVLDVGCGTGNDFPFFLSKKATITAFDKSAGMLNKAHEKYAEAIKSQKITLLKGHLEEFETDSIMGKKYDLIFSATGGLSYIDDGELERIFKLFNTLLKPQGKIITAHFNKFCMMEELYNFIRFKFSLLNQRNNDRLLVNIKNENMTMYLRSIADLLKLKLDFKQLSSYPLLVFTPPYQTGYTTGKILFKMHQIVEHSFLNIYMLSRLADQVVMVFSND